MVGVSGGELGIRGFVVALDASTGEEVWKTHTVPAPGEFGNDTWPGDSWRTGGAAVWVPGHYDPQLGLTYWGTGNGSPWFGDQRPGDNLYTRRPSRSIPTPVNSRGTSSTTGTTLGTGTR